MDSSITDVWLEPVAGVPAATTPPVTLGAARPNPSSGGVTATLALATEVDVAAAIFDLAGRRVRTLASGPRSGTCELSWDGRGSDGRPAARGLYLLRVRAGGRAIERKVMRR